MGVRVDLGSVGEKTVGHSQEGERAAGGVTMLRRKSRRSRDTDTLAALVSDAVRLDYGGGHARRLQRPGDERVPPQREEPMLSSVVERYYLG